MSSTSEKTELSEAEIIEFVKFLRPWRARMQKSPESNDNVQILQLENYFMLRLSNTVMKKYLKEKGLE